MSKKLDLEQYKKVARQAAAEGCVLIKNENETLPLRKGDRVAVFGRCCLHYYKSGLGSGGLVNTRYVVSILDALKACEDIVVEEDLLQVYEDWTIDNPIDRGQGWSTIPLSQKEMPLTEEAMQAAKDADVAIVIIGRTAGEAQDNKAEEGSYYLTQIERDMIAKVSKAFPRTIVLLNVGNIIDMNWVEEYKPSAVMYVWQGGQEGGNGVLDVLTGKVNPCGKLTDTIAYRIEDYPSTEHFGDQYKNYYTEDIYVGYRYFETFAKEKVQYPFGFGLSYTRFDMHAELQELAEDELRLCVKVTNIGNVAGKEVVQAYVQAPQGLLGKPARVLVGFAKTAVLQPGETEELVIVCPKKYFASYDDVGVTGHKSCYVLESGEYSVYVGADVRTAETVGNWHQEFQVLEELQEACAPVEAFERMRAMDDGQGGCRMTTEAVPLRAVDIKERINCLRKEAIPYSGNKGHILGDVLDGNVSLEEFIAQLSDEDLLCIFRGEGMCSPKVTPGTAGAFGGLTESLRSFGIPAICCADGPSGIRMDCGTKAFSLPNGAALGCSFNLDLVRELYVQLGMELRKNKVDTLLGPGINIHRNPLNGRNFEYFSEDPLLTGKMGAVQISGIQESDVAGTIKHYAANNQEQDRRTVEAVVSERALREIYLRGYEICVKEAEARAVMTAYNPINGIWSAGNFDLCTTILRKEWGFEGIVMTDWWSLSNWDDEPAEDVNRAPMVRAQNDIFMCCANTEKENDVDNVKASLENGRITRYDLQRNAGNILKFIMKSPAMLRELGRIEEEEEQDAESGDVEMGEFTYFSISGATGELVIEKEELPRVDGEITMGISFPESAHYSISLEVQSALDELAQLPLSLYVDNLYRATYSFRGTNGKAVERKENIGFVNGRIHFVKLALQDNGLEINRIVIKRE